jgi:hypothetical protein
LYRSAQNLGASIPTGINSKSKEDMQMAKSLIAPELPALRTLAVEVDYEMTLNQMIDAGGFSVVNPNITSNHFPINGDGIVELNVVLVKFNRSIFSDCVLNEIDQLGLRLAVLPELLALGATYPEAQRQLPIIALGSYWRDSCGCREVPCLNYWSAERGLSLCRFEGVWHQECCFAAVRKRR